MNNRALLGALTLLCISSVALPETPSAMDVPVYDKDELVLPANYREWIYLSTGFDMSYRAMGSPGHHMFDNVFAEPFAYKSFLRTGTWPDKTLLVLEMRGAGDKGSINQRGNYQDGEVMGLEVHVKDTERFEGGWAFFQFDGQANGKLVPHTEDCYSCHASHAAVDTTFVQFYPTLLPVAQSKGTLSKTYVP
jgi:Cytochrome P460